MKILIYILIACIACTSNAQSRRRGHSIQQINARAYEIGQLLKYGDLTTEEKRELIKERVALKARYDAQQAAINNVNVQREAQRACISSCGSDGRYMSSGEASIFSGTSKKRKVRYHESRNYKSKLRMKMAGKKHR